MSAATAARTVSVSSGVHSHDSSGAVMPARAQRERLVDDRGAQPGRPAGQRGARGRHQPVAVAVGLDDGHDLGRGAGLERRDVLADRREVDDGFGAQHAPSLSNARRRDGAPAADLRR